MSFKFENKPQAPFLSLCSYFRLLWPQINWRTGKDKEILSSLSDPFRRQPKALGPAHHLAACTWVGEAALYLPSSLIKDTKPSLKANRIIPYAVRYYVKEKK